MVDPYPSPYQNKSPSPNSSFDRSSMAYYDDRFMWAQQHITFYSVAHQDPVSFSTYEPYGYVDTNYDASNVSVFHEPKCIDHGYQNDYNYNYDYDYDKGYDFDGYCHNWYSSPNPGMDYLEHNYMEPKLIVYEPVEYSISYSKVDLGFNEPEFEEYDPTPYGGGYDIISQYGNPLPPSDKTCYPRSKTKPIGSMLTPISIEPMPTPNSDSQPETMARSKPEPEPESRHMPIATPIPLSKPELKPEPEPEPKPKPELASVPPREPLELNEVAERENDECNYHGYVYDYPWPEYENANATGVGYDYGYGKQVVQVPPYEYSPEVVDFCESIFGSWPCLAKVRNQQMVNDNNKPQMSCPEIGHLNPLEECASYFFGRPKISYNV